MAAFRLVAWFVVLMSCRAAKFTLIPATGRSHFLVFDRLAQTLVTRGHQVQLFVGDTERYASGHPNTLQYKTPQTFFDRMTTRHGSKKGLDVVSEMTNSAKLNAVYCDALLNTIDLMEEIKNSDLIIGDGLYFCSSLIAGKCSIPHVVIVTSTLSLPTMHAFSLPLPPSYVPQFKSSLSDKMSFMQRLKNSYQWLLVYWVFWYCMVPPFQDLKEKYDIAPQETMYETLGRVDMIISQRPFTLEYPRPLLPNTKIVGPLLAATPKSLSFDWEQFMQTSGDEGVILVSFGSILKNLSEDILTKMAYAFSRIPQKIIWKLDKDSEAKVSFGNNIKVASWLPQNDILGHNKTKLFFNHGGVNGMMEAVFHGVPMVFNPFFGDQFDNAQTAKWFGIAEVLDLDLVTADELIEIIVKVISTPSYRDSVTQMSKSIKLLPRAPAQEAADWVEYTLAQGDLQHLRPKGLDLPFYKLYLLDVLLLVVIIMFIACLILNLAFRALKSVLLARGKEKKH